MEYIEKRKILGIIPLPDKVISQGKEIKGRRSILPFARRRSIKAMGNFLEVNEKTGTTDLSPTDINGAKMWRRLTRINFKAVS